jgi:hypothetical protein
MPELLVGLTIAAILVLAVSGVLAGDQGAWQDVYGRVYGNVATGADVARRTFDTTVHRGSKSSSLVDATGAWIEVQYYASQTSSAVDSYAHFSVSSGNLSVEYGQLNPKVAQTTVVLCGNVTSCLFLHTGDSAQMVLALNDGSHSTTITSSAVMHVQ